MKPKLLLRIVSLLTFLVGVGHTIGHFTRKVTDDPKGIAVIKQMEQYQFNFNGNMRSWDNFYEGLSLEVALVLFVFTVIFSMLSGTAKKHPRTCYQLLWPYLIGYIGFTIAGFRYFFVVPAIATLICCVLIIITMVKLRRIPKQISLDNSLSV